MERATQQQKLLQQAIQACRESTGLAISTETPRLGEHDPDARVLIKTDSQVIPFAVDVRPIDRFQTLGAVKAKATRHQDAVLLIAPYISEAMAEKCRALHLAFMDTAGNTYLEAPGLFVLVTGRRQPDVTSKRFAYRALSPAGLRIIFALLTTPALVASPYRTIASSAQVALGMVGKVLDDLQHRGFLTPGNPGPRRLLNRQRLLDEWVTHYPIKLRPQLHPRRYTSNKPNGWRDLDLRPFQASWGGEVAAEKLTGYLKPERVTIYIHGNSDKLILEQRLRPDPFGEIEILKRFWEAETTDDPPDIAPPLLVYADLMASNEPRNIETAKQIHERYLV